MLKDIDLLLDFVGLEGIVTQSRNGSFPTETLTALNARVGHPIQLVLKRPLLKDYPNLAGLFILLRVMELFQTRGSRLVVCPLALELWRKLNPTEQYFTLLESLLFQAQSSVLGGEPNRSEEPAIDAVPVFLGQLSEHWRKFNSYESGYDLGPRGKIPLWSLFVQQQLGLIDIRPRTTLQKERWSPGGRGWLVGAAKLTPWGKAVTWTLLDFLAQASQAEAEQETTLEILKPSQRFKMMQAELLPSSHQDKQSKREDSKKVEFEQHEMDCRGEEDSEAEAGFGILQPFFQPFFPEWQTIYHRPERAARQGIHIFKVILSGWRGNGRIWRRLAVTPDTSLDGLASAILDAFNLDHDHLYDFKYRDQRGMQRVYHHPCTDDGPFTPEILVGQTDLSLKDEMLFTFDYGDYWEFKVRLESIEAASAALLRLKVIESAGKAPDQYPAGE